MIWDTILTTGHPKRRGVTREHRRRSTPDAIPKHVLVLAVDGGLVTALERLDQLALERDDFPRGRDEGGAHRCLEADRRRWYFRTLRCARAGSTLYFSAMLRNDCPDS